MKKVIATALATLLASLGFVVVDKSWTDRVETLESQVLSLAEVSAANGEKVYKVGDSIPCTPAAPYSFKSHLSQDQEVTVYIDEFTAAVIGVDEVNTDGFTGQTNIYYDTRTTSIERTTIANTTVHGGIYQIYSKSNLVVSVKLSGHIQYYNDSIKNIAIKLQDGNFDGVFDIPVSGDGSFSSEFNYKTNASLINISIENIYV